MDNWQIVEYFKARWIYYLTEYNRINFHDHELRREQLVHAYAYYLLGTYCMNGISGIDRDWKVRRIDFSKKEIHIYNRLITKIRDYDTRMRVLKLVTQQ